MTWNLTETGTALNENLFHAQPQLASGLLLKILKHFEVMLNIFEFSLKKEIVESRLVIVNKFSCITQSYFLPRR